MSQLTPLHPSGRLRRRPFVIRAADGTLLHVHPTANAGRVGAVDVDGDGRQEIVLGSQVVDVIAEVPDAPTANDATISVKLEGIVSGPTVPDGKFDNINAYDGEIRFTDDQTRDGVGGRRRARDERHQQHRDIHPGIVDLGTGFTA